jgi:serine/threonine protein kinase
MSAMRFEWVDGVTVGEWLCPEEDRMLDAELQYANLTLVECLHVVLAITSAVRGFHEAGMFHSQLNLSNILLDFTGGLSVKRCSQSLWTIPS